MTSHAMRDGVIVGTDAPQVAVARADVDPYRPDVAAYAVDPANDCESAFRASIADGAHLELHLACRDGRRERIALTAREAKRYVKADLETRIKIAETAIGKRRFGVAAAAALRLVERDEEPSRSTLTPDEDAYLREFGALEAIEVPLPDGGYRRGVRLREAVRSQVGRRNLKTLREDGFFDGWGAGADGAYGVGIAPSQREYLPRGGPAGQQQSLGDIWDTQAKCYYAWTHDPLAHRGCEILSDFVVGRSVSVICTHPAVQRIVDEFLNREEIVERLPTTCVSLSRDGELFGRIIRIGDGRIRLRLLAPATIWDCVCDGDDISQIYYWVQRYQTRSSVVGSQVPQNQARWIERTILADDMVHTKVNASETDVRGRSDIYPALGWLKRLRDYFDAAVQKEYAAAAYQFHYKVKGGQPDVSRIAAAVTGRPPVPGQAMVTNDLVEMTAVSSGSGSKSTDEGVYGALVNHIAIAFGLSKDYFGAASRNNRASALIATEPSSKRFEQRQDVIQSFLKRVLTQVVDEARRYGRIAPDVAGGEESTVDYGFRVVFPTIIKADAAGRMQMIRQAEGMGYISHQRAAREVAGEIEVDQFDYDAEMTQIEEETGQDPRSWIMRDVQPVLRGIGPGIMGDPTADPSSQGQQQSAIDDTGGGAPDTFGDAGDASPTGATGAAKIRSELGTQGLRAAARSLSEAGALVLFPEEYP